MVTFFAPSCLVLILLSLSLSAISASGVSVPSILQSSPTIDRYRANQRVHFTLTACSANLVASSSLTSSSESSTISGLERKLLSLSGGSTSEHKTTMAQSQSQPAATKESRLTAFKRTFLCLWGVVQVVSVLANAIKRLLPIALQPLQQNDLSAPQWALYIAWCAYMTYAEGYKAFQQKFSPMVVDRAYGIVDNANIFNTLLAGPYAMGLFGAEKKRMIVSWAITAGVFSLVKVVKFLPYPYRSIVDGGVVCGLSYGAISIVLLTLRRLFFTSVVEATSETATPAKKDK